MASAQQRYSSTNVRQDVFPLDQWTITTRKGIIMQSKCTCRSAEPTLKDQQQPNSNGKAEKGADIEPIELCDICRYHRFLPQLHTMPDMLFNNNLLRLEHSSGVGIEFNPLDALRLVEETSDPLKVAVADGWQSARADCPFANKISRPFDWTFTTNYRGTLLSAIKKSKWSLTDKSDQLATPEGYQEKREDDTNHSSNKLHNDNVDREASSGISKSVRFPHEDANFSGDTSQDRLSFCVEETEERINLNKLKVKEDILFYDDITLYEDELADHGTAQYSVKVRVMPSSFFLLARYYLRIDGVMARINDTRIYHELRQDYVLREYTNREAKFSGLNLPISTIVNPSELMNHLPIIEKRYEKLILPRRSAR